MGNFRGWLFNFMQGRYGYDQLGQALSIAVVVAWIASLIVGLVARLVASYPIALLSQVLNWVGLIALVFMIFRVMSRNHERRRAENEWYLSKRYARREKKSRGKGNSQGAGFNRDLSREQAGYKYLSCGFCGQQMRVPSGKGKIAVKCPACGEKTIVNS